MAAPGCRICGGKLERISFYQLRCVACGAQYEVCFHGSDGGVIQYEYAQRRPRKKTEKECLQQIAALRAEQAALKAELTGLGLFHRRRRTLENGLRLIERQVRCREKELQHEREKE